MTQEQFFLWLSGYLEGQTSLDSSKIIKIEEKIDEVFKQIELKKYATALRNSCTVAHYLKK